MPENFVDSLQISIHAGKGGDGAVHFDSRKYEAFGGPDGGDGGNGGSVVLVGEKNYDNLASLQYMKFRAADGGNGAGGLKSGSDAGDLAIRVPPGTLAYDARTGMELGYVLATGDEYILARGGKGGRGNPKYATGSRRTPRIAQSGEEGVSLNIELNWRIYADSMLIEPHETVLEEELLLPLLTGKDPLEIEFELFRRKPRWLRIGGLYANYDVAYLPVVLFEDGEIEGNQLQHVYWAKHLFINLQPFGENAAAAWLGLAAKLESLTFRHLEMLTVSAELELDIDQISLDIENAERPDFRMQLSSSPQATLEQFMGQLCGDVVN
jgi:hypothetical protein